MSARPDSELTEKLFAALRASVDERALAARVAEIAAPSSSPSTREAAAPSSKNARHDEHAKTAANELLARWSLADVLDETILPANPSSKGYPLRVLFAEMSATMASSDEALAFAAAVNLFFRTSGEEEARVALGIEVSRAFYAFSSAIDVALRPAAAQSLATLLSSDLPRLRFESVDHLATFDSAVHERDRGSGQGATVREVRTFLCRITATGMVRTKARVLT